MKKQTLGFSVGGESFEGLRDLPDNVLNDFGIFRSCENGFTFGSLLQAGEYEGEGLPETGSDKVIHCEREISFKFRLSSNAAGNDLNLELAEEGTGRHFKFPFEGLDAEKAYLAATEFDQLIYPYLYKMALHHLAFACYRQQNEDAEIQKESCELIGINFEAYFGQVLKPKRFKQIGLSEKKGVRITTLESIEAGRKPKTNNEINSEKAVFIKKVFDAFRQIDAEGGKKTRLDVGLVLFENIPGEPDIASRMKRALKKFGLLFRYLKTQYEAEKGAQNEI